MKLIKGYEALISQLGYAMDDARKMHWGLGLEPGQLGQPSTVSILRNGSRQTLGLVMPDAALLKQPEDASVVKFNPMAEAYIARGPSDVQNRLILDTSAVMVPPIAVIALALTELSLDTSKHENLSPEIFELISKIPTVKAEKTSKKVLEFAKKVFTKHTGARGKNAIGRFKLRRDVRLNETPVARMCEYITPYFNRLMPEVLSSEFKAPNKASVEVVAAVAKLLREELTIAAGSNEKHAPYFRAYLECTKAIMDRVTRLSNMLSLQSYPGFTFDTSWYEDSAKWGDYFRKEMNIRFEGNEGPFNGDIKAEAETTGVIQPANEPVKAPEPVKAKAPAAAPAVKVEALEDQNVDQTPIQTAAQPQPAAASTEKAPIMLGQHNTLVSDMHNTINAQSNDQYASPFSKKPSAADQQVAVHTPVQQASVAAPVTAPATTASSSSLIIEEDAPVASSLIIEEDDNLVQLHDANRQPVNLRNGQPYMVPADQVPNFPFVQKSDARGNKMFDASGTPILKKAKPLGQQGQQVNQYNTMQTQSGNVNSLYNNYQPQMQQQQPAQMYSQPQMQQQPQMMPVYNRTGQQVNPQFDANGNAMLEMFNSAMQPVTRIEQVMPNNGMMTQPSPVANNWAAAQPQQPAAQMYNQPQYNQPQYNQPQAQVVVGNYHM